MRVLIDYHFETYTLLYYKLQCILFAVGYFLPLITQIIWVLSRNAQVLLTGLFLMTHIILFHIETIQMRTEGWKYLRSFWNIIELFSALASLYYSFNVFFCNNGEVLLFHQMDLDLIAIRGNRSEIIDHHFNIMVCVIFLIIASIFKFLSILRVFEEYAHFVQVILMCMEGSVIFIAFLFYWIFAFQLLLLVMGVTFDDGDYTGLSSNAATLIQVYRNSVGDIQAPLYKLWLIDKDDESYYKSHKMIAVIWYTWLAHQFFCMVMLLNFLISIISEIYTTTSTY